MTQKKLNSFKRLTNNGIVAYLSEKELKGISMNMLGSDVYAQDAISRSQNINKVIVSKLTK